MNKPAPFHDHTISVEGINALEAKLRASNDDVEWHFYDGAHHGFFNDTRPDVHHPDNAALAFQRVTQFMSNALA